MQTKKCAYCRKPIAQGKEVKKELRYVHGAQLARKENDYCSKQCAEHDQMAHES
ncbi:YdaE family protein [Phytobacter palmae]|uniref:YdaE family protein n=1 Tax=Phytobacter palmae TaxID=1855371 RepID=A0ABU9VAG6_9ENTR